MCRYVENFKTTALLVLVSIFRSMFSAIFIKLHPKKLVCLPFIWFKSYKVTTTKLTQSQLIYICNLAVMVFFKEFQWDQRTDHSKMV